MITFDEALDARIGEEILDRCTSCGKCAAVCPMPEPAGLDAASEAAGAKIVTGIIDYLQGGDGTEDALKWSESCTGSGYCIEACPEAVNPRFMLAMARLKTRRKSNQDDARANGRKMFSHMSSGVRALTRLQLPPELLDQLNPPNREQGSRQRDPEVVFYTGCNMLRTPQIGLLCLEIMDAMDVPYEVMGGPGQCCGIYQFREGDTATAEKISGNTMDGFAATKAREVLAWCPSCVVQFSEINFPAFEKTEKGPAPFEMLAFYVWLADHLDALKPLMTRTVNKRVALVERPGIPGARDAAVKIARAIPGVEYVPLPDVQRAGITSNYLSILPQFKEKLLQEEFDACIAGDVNTLATIFHTCHRETCHLGEGRPFEIVNLMELVGESMGIYVEDLYKKLKVMGDVDAILADCAEMIEEHSLNVDALRAHLEADMVHSNPFHGMSSED